MEIEGLKEVFRKHRGEIRAAFLFGSRVEGRAGPLSDYDFAVLPKREYMRGEGKLELISSFCPI